MTQETQETRSTPKPSWLELPEEAKQKHTYWTVFGDDIPGPSPSLVDRWFSKWKANCGPTWLVVYHSKEEAEADAVNQSGVHWAWDKEPAKTITLHKSMGTARRQGRAGVVCRGFKDGKWQTLKTWPAGEPLINDDQENGR